MTAVRRVLSAGCILALLAFNLACPFGGPSMPETVSCSNGAPEARVDGVVLDARFERGLQGTLMVVARVEWLGDAAPACANVDVRVLDENGEEITGQATALETEASDGGRQSVSPVYLLVSDGLCEARVEIDSYGHTDRLEILNGDSFDCVTEEDAGASSDGGDP